MGHLGIDSRESQIGCVCIDVSDLKPISPGRSSFWLVRVRTTQNIPDHAAMDSRQSLLQPVVVIGEPLMIDPQ